MLTHAVSHRLANTGRLASARNWRTQAELLRDGAEAQRASARETAPMAARAFPPQELIPAVFSMVMSQQPCTRAGSACKPKPGRNHKRRNVP